MLTMVVDWTLAEGRLGLPRSSVERGTIDETAFSYSRHCSWSCGCRGEIIAGSLIELSCCDLHAA
jgi:hypothetical protein